jgi:tripartite-type tricarboxylate transporter receptor subunit TctC
MTHAKSGKLRLLAITSDKRSPLLPEVPTMAEAGVKNAEMLQWFAVMGPAKLPADITRRLNTELAAILKQPDVVEKIASQGGEIMGGSPEQFSKFIATDSAAFAKLVKDARITLE